MNQVALRTAELDANYYVDKRIRDMVTALTKKGNANFLLSGPPGSGKSSFAEQFAAVTGRPIFDVACGRMQEVGQWFGEMAFSPEHGTYYKTSAFVEALATPNCVILLDEINRVESPKVNNALLPILDHRQRVFVEEIGRDILVAEGVVIFATINEGLDFNGIDPIDLALRDRFYSIAMNYPSMETISNIIRAKTKCSVQAAADLISVVTKVNSTKTLPMRDLLKAATLMASGIGLRDAVDFGFSRAHENHAALLQMAQNLDKNGAIRTGRDEILWTV